VRSASEVSAGAKVDVQLAVGVLGATVERVDQ
jgi:hypothetical protein